MNGDEIECIELDRETVSDELTRLLRVLNGGAGCDDIADAVTDMFDRFGVAYTDDTRDVWVTA